MQISVIFLRFSSSDTLAVLNDDGLVSFGVVAEAAFPFADEVFMFSWSVCDDDYTWDGRPLWLYQIVNNIKADIFRVSSWGNNMIPLVSTLVSLKFPWKERKSKQE